MKKYLAVMVLLLIFLAVLIPFASSNPDGLEKVAESLGVEEPDSFWKGLLGDYQVDAFKDPYVSTLVAGVLGTLLVLSVSLAFGSIIAKRAGTEKTVTNQSEKQVAD